MPGVSDAELGMSRTVFLFSYALMVPFIGVATDFFRRKWVIVFGTAMFGVSVFFTGYAESMLMLFVMYGVLNGIGQCMIPSAAGSLVAQYHVTTRSTALSIYQSALYVGVILSSVSSGWFSGLSGDGWRWPFWVFGGISLVWVAALIFFLRDTPPVEVAGSDGKPKLKEACLAMVSKPSACLSRSPSACSCSGPTASAPGCRRSSSSRRTGTLPPAGRRFIRWRGSSEAASSASPSARGCRIRLFAAAAASVSS
jgi:MFS family permease